MNASQVKIAELKKEADRAYAAYDRASRHIGANEAECSKLYFAQQKATDEWQAAVRAADRFAPIYA